MPARFRSYPDIVPDLAIEVESPTDKPYQTQAKIAEYQKAGVSLVWVIHPYTRTVDVYDLTTGDVPQIVTINGELSGGNVIPGFKLLVRDIFDYPADPDPDPEVTK